MENGTLVIFRVDNFSPFGANFGWIDDLTFKFFQKRVDILSNLKFLFKFLRNLNLSLIYYK